jgi:ABC-type glycerol-3-phosphate transport system permease component
MTKPNQKARKLLFTVFIYFIVLLVLIFALAPVLWSLSTSLKPDTAIFSQPPQWIPKEVTASHYAEIFRNPNMLRYYLNSFITAAASTVIALFVGVLGAYGFSRFKFPGSRNTMLVIMLSRMLPRVSLIVPFFITLQKLRLYNTRPGLVIIFTVITMPLSIWMLKGFFDSIPYEIEEAAIVDGCSPLGILFKIDLPLLLPAFASVGMYIFIVAWNEFLLALTMTRGKELRTISIGLAFFIDEFGVRWGQLMAASVLMSIPAIVVFLVFSKFLIKGLAEGGVKG